MADLPLNNKLKQDEQQQQGGSSFAGGSQPAGSGGGSIISSGPVSTAGVGAGGTGGWTPIQAYLKANQGSTGTATALERDAGSAISSDKSRIETQAKDSKSSLEAAQGQKVAKDQASQIIDQYTQGQGDLSKIQGYLGSSYQAKPVDLSLSADTQAYGNGVSGDQKGFNAILQKLYNKESGGKMGAGASALQQQLDQDNSAVNQARQNASAQYKALKNMAYGEDGNTGLLDLNRQMGEEENSFRSGQSEVRNSLGDQAKESERTYNFAGNPEAYPDYGAAAPRDPIAAAQMQNDAAKKYNAIMEALGMGNRKELVAVPTSLRDQIAQQQVIARPATPAKAPAQQKPEGGIPESIRRSMEELRKQEELRGIRHYGV